MNKYLQSLRSKLFFKSFGRQGGTYFRLLLANDPEFLDYALLLIGVVAAVAAGLPFPLLGILFGQLVDDLNSASCSASSNSSSITDSVQAKVLLLIWVAIANFFFIYIHTGCWSLLGERLVRRLRREYLEGLLRQEMAFFDTLPSGEVASRLDVDLQTIQTGSSEKVGICIASLSYFVASYIVALIKSAKLAGMLFSLVPAYLIVALVGGHFTQKYAGRVSDHVAAATAIASAALSNLSLVQAFGANLRLEKVFAVNLALAEKCGIKKAFVASIQLGCLYFVAYSANALAFWEGSKQISASVVSDGPATTVGAIYTVIFLLVDSSFIISQVAPFVQLFSAAASAFDKLVATTNRKSQIDGTGTEGLILSNVSGGLEFRSVSFAYPSRPDIQILKTFSLKIPANKHTALVGSSGSGKSTVAAMLQRLYDPNTGDVLLDGHSLRDINVRCVRSLTGVVSQNSTLFDRSILENIAYGLVNSPLEKHFALTETILDSSLPDLVMKIRNGVNVEEAIVASSDSVKKIVHLVREAAHDADALSFIDRLQHGLATNAGPSGNRLSGGQKQRVALARTLIRNPSILLLDEATASVDSTSERLIQRALDRVSVGRTSITIAHRLSTVKNAHNIVVMGPGAILEQGTYTELLAKGGPFASMVKLQSLQAIEQPADNESRISGDSEITESPSQEVPRMNLLDGPQLLNEKALEDGAHHTTAEICLSNVDGSNEDTNDASKLKRPFLSTFFSIFLMARRHLLFIFLGISAAVVVGGSYSGEAVIFGHTISDLNPCRGAAVIRHSGNLYGLVFFILAVVEFLANVISTSSFGYVSEKLLFRVRIQSLQSLFTQDKFWHESEGRTPGTLISYISSDANSLSGITGTVLGVILSIVVSLFAGTILAHIVAWRIAVVLLATVPILLASGFFRLRVLTKFHERHQKAFASSVSLATEAVDSIKTVAMFSLEQETVEVFNRSLKGPYLETLKTIAYGNFWLAMAFSMGNLIYALAYWWGAHQVIKGNSTQQQFFTVLPALLFSAQLSGQMFSLAPDISKAGVAAARVLDLIDIGPQKKLETINGPRLDDVESSHGTSERRLITNRGIAVTFNEVHFSYPARHHVPVLRGLSLEIPPGAFCALVGPSGAGKSTVIALIEKFYSPSSGSVEIDGINISKVDSVDFRDDIALVPQESVLFDGTVLFNLSLGARPGYEPSNEEIQVACKLANIHDAILFLPQGYETPCGSNGNQFSGGQMQRLSIARALLRKPRLLLLDESTSALDAESERFFEETLEKTARNCTVIAIAHRLHTIRKASCIFMIEDGKCVDRGTHVELVSRNKEYRENALHQTLEQ